MIERANLMTKDGEAVPSIISRDSFDDWPNKSFDDGRGDSPRFLTAYSPPRPSIQTLAADKAVVNGTFKDKRVFPRVITCGGYVHLPE